MTKANGDTIQAVPLMEGQIGVGAGTYTCKGILHAEDDAVITLPFPSGVVTVNLSAGQDRGYVGEFTVVSGSITYE
jgi:hypothetical protein